MKKMNNKGFSLVELIIVIAIMAVLVGVLAPQFLRYVEQSRVQKDESAMGEVCNATKIAMSIEEVYDSIDASASFSFGGTVTTLASGLPSLSAELQKTIPDCPQFSSKTYKGHDATCHITIDTTTNTVQVSVDNGVTTFVAR